MADRREPKDLCAMVTLHELAGRWVELKRKGPDWWGLCPFHAEKTPSFTVNDEKGFYHCFGCGAHGDALDFLRSYHGWEFGQAREYLERQLGIAQGEYTAPPMRAPAAKKAQADRDEKAWKVGKAAEIWRQSLLANCTPVERYLLGRGDRRDEAGGVPPSLRYHRRLYHSETGRGWWAMVSYIKGPDDTFTGIHRTYLEEADPWANKEVAAAVRACGGYPKRGVIIKAQVHGAKKMLGVAKGGAVRLAAAGPVLAVAEGIETALSVMQATELPAWAALSLGNLGGLKLPGVVHEVVLCSDNDAKDPQKGRGAAAEGGRRVPGAGRGGAHHPAARRR